MPLVRLSNGKLLYYAHVPKAAGSAVENYLAARFGPLGMLDRGFARRSPAEAWSLSPPQHIPDTLRAALLPDGLFDSIFTTIRHPATRLRSIFQFAREAERSLPWGLTFNRWLDDLPRVLATDAYALNGHLRPMVDLVPARAEIFRIEDGLDAVKTWLDTQAGEEVDDDIGTANVRAARLAKLPAESRPQDIVLTPTHLSRIADIYSADYARFGYDIDPVPTDKAPSHNPNPVR